MDGGQLDGSVLEIVLSDLPLPERSPSPLPVRRRSPLPSPRRRSRSPLGVRRGGRSPSPPYRRGYEPPARGGWGTGMGGRDVRLVPASYGGRPTGRRSPSPRPRGRRPLSRSRSPVGRRCALSFPALLLWDVPLCALTNTFRYRQVCRLALEEPGQAAQLLALPLACAPASVRTLAPISLSFRAPAERHPLLNSSYSRSLSRSISRSPRPRRSFSRSVSPAARRARSMSKRSDRSMRSLSRSRSPVRRRSFTRSPVRRA
jgi:hypothetical protein